MLTAAMAQHYNVSAAGLPKFRSILLRLFQDLLDQMGTAAEPVPEHLPQWR